MYSEQFNYREVGSFDVLNPVITPIGALDAADLHRQLQGMIEQGAQNLAIDLTGIDSLYSDSLTAIGRALTAMEAKGSVFGMLGVDPSLHHVLKNANLFDRITFFRDETDMIMQSMKMLQEQEKRTQKLEVAEVALGVKEAPPEEIEIPELEPIIKEPSNAWKYWTAAGVILLLALAWFFRP